MKERLRIALADDEKLMQRFLEETLTKLGHDVVAVADNGIQLVEACRRLKPDLVITDIKMPDMDGLEAADQLCSEDPLPIIIVSAYSDEQFLNRAGENQILAYLLKPVKESDLVPAITIATRRFDEFRQLRKETNDLRQALADRKRIERAKGILMQQAQLDEAAAFRRLQQLARNNNKKLVDVADMILLTADALTNRVDIKTD